MGSGVASSNGAEGKGDRAGRLVKSEAISSLQPIQLCAPQVAVPWPHCGQSRAQPHIAFNGVRSELYISREVSTIVSYPDLLARATHVGLGFETSHKCRLTTINES